MAMKYVTRLIAIVACALSCAGCVLDREGMVVLTESGYRATMIGSSDDGFNLPDGILWRRGQILIADERGGAVRVWRDGQIVTTLCDRTLGIQAPEDLVMDRHGTVFFTDDEAGGVWEVDRDGRASLLAGEDKGLVSTEGIALAPSGDILVGDGARHQVFRVDRDGNVTVFLGPAYGIAKPESMVWDDHGNLYIADNEDQVVYLVTPDMQLRRLIDAREGFSPETLWYAGHVLYITDSTHGKLSRYTPLEGLKTMAVFAGTLSHVCGVTTDDAGSIYVSIQDMADATGYIVKLERDAAVSIADQPAPLAR
jgi:sugar lactone lactonase YvrE